MLCYLNSPVGTDLKFICGTPCLLSVSIASQPAKWCESGELANHVSASKLIVIKKIHLATLAVYSQMVKILKSIVKRFR